MLNVGSVKAELNDDRIERMENNVSEFLALVFFVVDEIHWRYFALFTQVQSSLKAVFWYQNLKRVLPYEQNVALLVLYFLSEK